MTPEKMLGVSRNLLAQLFWRDAGDPQPLWWMWLVNDVLGSFLIPTRVRTQLLRLCGLNLHPRALVRARVVFRSRNITVGSGSLIGYRCLFDAREGVTIGAHVALGADVRFLTSSHDTADPTRRAGVGAGSGPIVIGDGAWVSSAVTLLPGVTIGAGAVVGAGSLVTRDTEPHTLNVGLPAKKVRDLPQTPIETADH